MVHLSSPLYCVSDLFEGRRNFVSLTANDTGSAPNARVGRKLHCIPLHALSEFQCVLLFSLESCDGCVWGMRLVPFADACFLVGELRCDAVPVVWEASYSTRRFFVPAWCTKILLRLATYWWSRPWIDRPERLCPACLSRVRFSPWVW